MAICPDVFIATLVTLAGLPGAAQSEAPRAIRPLRPVAEQPPQMRDSVSEASSRLVPTSEVRRLPALTVDPSSREVNRIWERCETLKQAWAVALEVDRQLQSKRHNVSSAQQFLQSARAQRWPTLGIEGSYTARSADPAFRFDSFGIPLPTNVFRYAQNENAAFFAKADLPLYTSGRIRHGIDAAAANVTSATFELAKYHSDLKMSVAEEYIMVLRAQREVEVTQSAVRSLEAHARDVEMLLEQKQVPRNDLLAAQVALSHAQQRAIRANNHLDASRAAYNRRLGRPLTSAVRIAELPVEMMAGDVETLTARALRTRPAVAGLSAQIHALRYQAAGLRARNRPQAELRGEYVFEENRFRSPEGIAAVGVGVSWNLFDGGRNRYEAAALSQRAESLSRTQADLESVIALEVRRAWLDVHETRRRLTVTLQACQRADENLRVARKRYSVGVGTNTEVLDAETLRTETYRNHYNATYDAILAVLRLRHATGELGP